MNWSDIRQYVFAGLYYLLFFWAVFILWGDGKQPSSVEMMLMTAVIMLLALQDVEKSHRLQLEEDVYEILERVKGKYPDPPPSVEVTCTIKDGKVDPVKPGEEKKT